jgi:hypothetical protein
MLESHEKVLLNRNPSFLFYTFFSGPGKREFPSSYLCNTYACALPPQQCFAAEAVSFPMEGGGIHLLFTLFLFCRQTSFPEASNLNFSVRFLPGVTLKSSYTEDYGL